MKSRFQSRLEEMEAMKKSLADGAKPESNKIKKEDIFDFDLKDFIQKELKYEVLFKLMDQRDCVMRLKDEVNCITNEEHINHLDKSIDYLNKEINKIIEL